MKRSRLALVLLATAGALALVFTSATFGGTTKKAASPYKVALILVGPHNDGGWSQAHYAGMQYVQKVLGSKVQFTMKENIAPGAQLNQTVASLSSQGYKMIFATSYGMVTKAVAAKYPNILFEQATGTDLSKNLAEYFGRAEDTVFLSGMAAGAASKTGKLGYVVAFPIPEVIRHANAFALGAQLTHPGATVSLVWTNSWFSPDKEKKAAQSLVGAGADVLGQNVDSPAAGQYAETAEGAVGRLRLRLVDVRAEVVADGRDVQLGPVHAEAGQGGNGRNVEVGLLLREHQRRLHRTREVRTERVRRDEGEDRHVHEEDRERVLLRVHGPALRPDRQAAREAGREDAGAHGRHEQPLWDELARQRRDRQRQGLAAVARGAPDRRPSPAHRAVMTGPDAHHL